MIWASSDLNSFSSSYPIGRQRICTHEAAASERDRHGQKLSEKLMALNLFILLLCRIKLRIQCIFFVVYIYTIIYFK